MSLENAINAHAFALSDLAAAIRDLVNTSQGAVVAGIDQGSRALTVATGQGSTGVAPDAELEKDVGKIEADAAQAKAMAAVEEKKAKAKAKKDAEAKAAADAAASAASSQTAGADSSDDAGLDADDDVVILDYKTEVRPVLLEAIKRTDKLQVQALVKSYGVDKGENLDPSVFAEVVAKANAMGV